MPRKAKSYQQNFITGVRMLMASNAELDTLQKTADHLEIGYMALYKVMDGTNNPTTELCIRLCQKAGYSANWLFLDQGQMYQEEEMEMKDLIKALHGLRMQIKVNGEVNSLVKKRSKRASSSK